MYRHAVSRLLDRVAEPEEFFRAGIVAIDITESDPFTGDRAGHGDEIIGTKEKTDEYAYQWATVQLVGNAVPIVLDARPVRKGDARKEIAADLLDSAEAAGHVDNVLMDREFDSQHILEMLSQRGLSYVVPKRMQTSEKAQAKRLLKRGKTATRLIENCTWATRVALDDIDLPAEGELRTHRSSTVFGVHDESE
ncbi:hypothetical protein SAMN05216218_11110 [Halorientalis regularis]|uniref:Transposase DDE domain-containing protein n=1 Tax=Halorientalis regularis TaxID=660518 RepID=A0A1G7PT94_9EURY|nr:hypothetical protein SAMN05216218_11110 [Halorientalis regularis]